MLCILASCGQFRSFQPELKPNCETKTRCVLTCQVTAHKYVQFQLGTLSVITVRPLTGIPHPRGIWGQVSLFRRPTTHQNLWLCILPSFNLWMLYRLPYFLLSSVSQSNNSRLGIQRFATSSSRLGISTQYNPLVLRLSKSDPSQPQQQRTSSTMTATQVLNRVTPDKVSMEIKDPVDPTALGQAKAILDELTAPTADGSVDSDSLLKVAKRLQDIPEDATNFVVSKEECKAAFEGLSEQERTALVNIHGRVKAFAEMQRKSVVDMEMDIPGGKAGHNVSPCSGTYQESLYKTPRRNRLSFCAS